MNAPDYKETGTLPFKNVRKSLEGWDNDPHKGDGVGCWTPHPDRKERVKIKKKKRKAAKKSRKRNRK